MFRWLKVLWCRYFHKYTGHLGFGHGDKVEWMCVECGREWVSPAQPDKLRPKPTTGK